MKFIYSHYNLKGNAKIMQRIFEMIPGLTSWFIIVFMTFLSFFYPVCAIVVIIAFLIYWIMRLIYLNIFLIISYMRMDIEKNVHWIERISEIDRWSKTGQVPKIEKFSILPFKKYISNVIYQYQYQKLKKSKSKPPLLSLIYHLVLIPVINESKKIIEPGINKALIGSFPAKKIVIVIALETRASEEVKKGCKEMMLKFKDHFFDFLIIEHPDNIEGEIRAKGANVTYSAKEMKKYFETKNINCENVIVSCFDSDTIVSKDYFSALTYHYMVNPDRNLCSYQPIPVYHNNIWDAASFARILDIGASFFQLIEATNPEKMITFSSHSMSFKALIDVGYWPVDMVSEDSAIFWKSFIFYDGKYKTIPIYVTLSMDIVNERTLWKTLKNVYKQKRRWAWGVENFPIVMRAFVESKKISGYNKLRYGFKLFERSISWTTWPFLLTIISWLPVVFAREEFYNMVVYYGFGRIKSIIFFLALIGLIVCVFLSLMLLPKEKYKRTILKRILHVFEWVLIPVISIFLSAIPALDSQTRLMFGKYLGFWVTPKNRRK